MNIASMKEKMDTELKVFKKCTLAIGKNPTEKEAINFCEHQTPLRPIMLTEHSMLVLEKLQSLGDNRQLASICDTYRKIKDVLGKGVAPFLFISNGLKWNQKKNCFTDTSEPNINIDATYDRLWEWYTCAMKDYSAGSSPYGFELDDEINITPKIVYKVKAVGTNLYWAKKDKNWGSIIMMHKEHGLCEHVTTDLEQWVMKVRKEDRHVVEKHDPEFTGEMIQYMLAAPDKLQLEGRTLDWSSIFGRALAGAIELASQGFRPTDMFWTNEESDPLQWSSLSLLLDGERYPAEDSILEHWQTLTQEGGCLAHPRRWMPGCTPAQSGVVPCGNTAYSRYHPTGRGVARRIAEMAVATLRAGRALDGPVFCDDDGFGLKASVMVSTLNSLVSTLHLRLRYTWLSFRYQSQVVAWCQFKRLPRFKCSNDADPSDPEQMWCHKHLPRNQGKGRHIDEVHPQKGKGHASSSGKGRASMGAFIPGQNKRPRMTTG